MPHQYKYSGYGIGFSFRIFIYRWKHGKNDIILGPDLSSSVHIDYENKNILVLSEGRTQGLDDTKLTAEAIHATNFTQRKD